MSGSQSFANTFRSEVARLARKEVRAGLAPALKDLARAKKTIVQQKREIADLQRSMKRLTGLLKQGEASSPERAESVGAGMGEKWRKDSVRSTRRKLQITQTEMAALLGVSIGSVNGWETGRTEPRQGRKQDVLALRGLTSAEARERLQ